MAEAVRVGDPAIEVRLRRNRRARRMVLRIARTGHAPTLTLPPGVPLRAAAAFLAEQEAWLRQHIEAGPPGIPVRAGAELRVAGHRLIVAAGPGRRTLVEGERLLVPGAPRDLPVRVGAFLREEAREACAAGVARHAATLGRRPRRITLRDPRSRWGSCTAAGDLMFSWRLILAPVAVLDYVVAHEVAHLAELNHSDRFWATVARLCPGHAAPRAWLRRNGPALHRYDFAPDAAG
jgi:hypothetical protein